MNDRIMVEEKKNCGSCYFKL